MSLPRWSVFLFGLLIALPSVLIAEEKKTDDALSKLAITAVNAKAA